VTVDYALADGIARLHLNRPERLNAVTPRLVEDLIAALGRAAAEAATVVVLAGRGRAFCSGYDLKEPAPVETPLQTRARVERLQEVTRAVRTFPGPVVAAVHGYALGAGCEFALACDVVVAAEDAAFGFPEVGVGLSVTGGISRFLVNLVGLARAKDLLLLGEHLSAGQARAAGLVARTGPPGEHETAAGELAARLAARPALATALAKRVLDTALDTPLDAMLAVEVDHAVLTAGTGENAGPRAAFGRG
jgi:2-(1,2-epoxy-1,2-dihydrophenyl)acetyl-CoA isomerase